MGFGDRFVMTVGEGVLYIFADPGTAQHAAPYFYDDSERTLRQSQKISSLQPILLPFVMRAAAAITRTSLRCLAGQRMRAEKGILCRSS